MRLAAMSVAGEMVRRSSFRFFSPDESVFILDLGLVIPARREARNALLANYIFMRRGYVKMR